MININYIRPSTLTRVVEDTLVAAVRTFARGVDHVATGITDTALGVSHAVRTEYEARRVSNFAIAAAEAQESLNNMTRAERLAFEAHQAEVMARTEELLAKYGAKRIRKQGRA